MLNDATTELIARRFRALAEPTRLRILQILEAGEQSVNSIVELLGSSQPNVSKHLKALSQEGLVDRRRDGLNIRYRIADPAVLQLCEVVCRSATARARSQVAKLDAIAEAAPGSRNGFHARQR